VAFPLKSQRSFAVDFVFLNREEPVPQVKNSRDRDSDQHADSKKHTIGREKDEDRSDHRDGNKQAGRSPHADSYLHTRAPQISMLEKQERARNPRAGVGTLLDGIEEVERVVSCGIPPPGQPRTLLLMGCGWLGRGSERGNGLRLRSYRGGNVGQRLLERNRQHLIHGIDKMQLHDIAQVLR
jgi:hypothetical protein